ncbi:hypothetical protein [Campylobacter rectus]
MIKHKKLKFTKAKFDVKFESQTNRQSERKFKLQAKTDIISKRRQSCKIAKI